MRAILIIACLPLAALAVAQWWLWPVPKPQLAQVNNESPNVEAEESNIMPEYELSPLEDYQEIDERTLFNDTRRLPEIEAAPTTAATPEPVAEPFPEHMGLTAILMTGDRPIALIRDKQNNEFFKLEQGENLSGWKIASILEDRLVLTQGENRQEMLLRIFDPSPPAPPPIGSASKAQTAKARAAKRPNARRARPSTSRKVTTRRRTTNRR